MSFTEYIKQMFVRIEAKKPALIFKKRAANNSKTRDRIIIIIYLYNKLNLSLFNAVPQHFCLATQQTQKIVQCCTNVVDVGPTMYKSYTNVLCLLGSFNILYGLFPSLIGLF